MDLDGVLKTWTARERGAGDRHRRDRETLEFFEGRIAVPMPEIDANEKAAVANLMAQGITAQAQRIASTQPNPVFPSLTRSEAGDKRARKKARALRGMWSENRLHLQRQQRARWLVAYASSPVVIRPKWDAEQHHWSVMWKPRSALSTYAAPLSGVGDMEPYDVIFATSHRLGDVVNRWPERAATVRAAYGTGVASHNTPVTLIEYYGPDNILVACVGNKTEHTNTYVDASFFDTKWAVQLENIDNRIGRCTAIVPNGIALEQPLSRYEGMKGLYQMEARLMALNYRYVANSVDPPVWFVENDQTGGEIVTVADGPAGVVGHVKGGSLQALNPPPGPATTNTIDRLERAQRLEGGVPADLGGESSTNIRTGVRGQDILSAVMDFPIQEAQMVMSESQRLEDMIAIDLSKEHFGDEQRTWGGFTFKAAEVFSGDNFHEAKYALPGTDANGLTIRMGQLQGTGLISKRTARENIPDIDDPEFEDDQVTAEQITTGILAEFMQPGSATLPDKARVAQLVGDDKQSLAAAIMQVQAEAQERQSTDVNPVAPGSPEAQPGIAPPGAGAEAGVGAPQGGLDHLRSLLGSLRLSQMSTPAERGAEAVATVG